ncbi:MAG: 3-hydroxyacyl-CoA dehydrogenase family protein [Candidatus Acidiferrales bacterium]
MAGTGTMAPGIAAAFAAAGSEVLLWGRRADAAETAVERAREMLRFLRENELAWTSGGSLAAVPKPVPADLVLEAIAEDVVAKRALFQELERSAGEGAILATNTSGLRVTDIALGLRRPERLVAMHFWNPAHLMPIVEICGGERTDPGLITRAAEITRQIGKVPVRLEKEVLGFLGTRLQQAVVREAIGLLAAGVASPEAIDLAVRASFGVRFPALGPLETTDLGGLDVILAIHRYLLPDLDRSSRPQPELERRVAEGKLGVKAGEGFYDWSRRDAQAVIRRRDDELVRRLKLIRSDPGFLA